MTRYIMGIVRIASLLPWTRSKVMGKALLGYLIYDAFVGLDHKPICIKTSVYDDGFKTILFPLLHLNLGCINSFCTPMYVELSWTYVICGLYVESCTILVVCWIIRDPSWYSMDYRVYMGSSMKVRSLRWLPLYLCSYKLVGSATAGIGAGFNIFCHVYLKQRFLFYKPSFGNL